MELDTVLCGDCLDILPTIPDASVDAVITDPPYPHIKRDYGTWTEAEWWEMVVEGVVPEVRRVLKPTGSAVFILQPNSRKVGSMRGWLFEFQAWVCREWNMVQDAYWWNTSALPTGEGHRRGLMKASVKTCIWAGNNECFRDRTKVMLKPKWTPNEQSLSTELEYFPSGVQLRRRGPLESIKKNGGCIPINILPISNAPNRQSAGIYGHGAGTPLALADWWTRYIIPPGGLVLDPFFGVGTMGIAAIKNRCHFIGIEKEDHYYDTARERIAKAQVEMSQMELGL